MKTIILSVSHNGNRIPDGTGCLPIIAGSVFSDEAVPSGYLRDDSGDNISFKNRNYCELTALYWAWKNLDADVLGICHYRRFFASPQHRNKILNEDESRHLLNHFDVILPKARNYIVETNYQQYVHSHHTEDLALTRDIISELHQDYLDAYDRRMAMTKGHRFNMFIMKRSLLDEYCSWLFEILFDLEKNLDISHYSENDKRVFGFVAERLLDVWLDKNDIRSIELEYIFSGDEHLFMKASSMLCRKIRGTCRNFFGKKHGKNCSSNCNT